MPAYWFIHNMYALARNCKKSYKRDERLKKKQMLHHQFLEPDSVLEMVKSVRNFEWWTGKMFGNQSKDRESIRAEGRRILCHHPEVIEGQEVLALGLENSNRPVVIRRIYEAYHIFKKLIGYNVATSTLNYWRTQKTRSIESLFDHSGDSPSPEQWENVGGQLIPQSSMDRLKKDIKSGEMDSWEDIHLFYSREAEDYHQNKWIHAVAAYEEVFQVSLKENPDKWRALLEESIDTRQWINQSIYASRAKDYNNSFRSLTYESQEEMEVVTGKLEENAFILDSQEECIQFEREIRQCLGVWQETKV